MPNKLHLRARPPHEAARRLAWFLGSGGSDAFDHFARFIDRHVSYIDRLISGEIEPGADESHAIWLATEGAVWSRDWRRPADGGWFDEPVYRIMKKAA